MYLDSEVKAHIGLEILIPFTRVSNVKCEEPLGLLVILKRAVISVRQELNM